MVAIADGDTITVLHAGKQEKVRLYGIDCPEKKQAFGTRARQFTGELAFQKKVTVRVKDTDRYGRLVGEVVLPDGRVLNRELVRAGLAWWYRQYAARATELERLQDEAQAAGRGLWADPKCIPPWEFRKKGRAKSQTGISPRSPLICCNLPRKMTFFVLWGGLAWFDIWLRCCASLSLSGCSIRRMAINKVGDALTSGASVYETDDDIELVGDALPFGLKLIESLLARIAAPPGAAEAACQGFTTYAYLYVQYAGGRVADKDMAAGEALRARARRLFLRAHRYGYRGLEVAAPGIGAAHDHGPARGASPRVRKKADVPLLYWNAAALGLAISVSKNDAAMLARLPEVEALVERALELDEAWQEGTLHEFQVTLGGRQARQTGLRPHREALPARAGTLAGQARGPVRGLRGIRARCPAGRERTSAPRSNKALAIDPDRVRDPAAGRTSPRSAARAGCSSAPTT